MKEQGRGVRALPRGGIETCVWAPMLLAWGVGCGAGASDRPTHEPVVTPPAVGSVAGAGGTTSPPHSSAGAFASAPLNEPDTGVPPGVGETTLDAGLPPDVPAMPDVGPEPPGAALGLPLIPAVTAQCPMLEDSVVTFMGLPGVQIVAGPKPEGPTAPMVFYWHGTGGDSTQFERYTAIAEGVREEGGVLVAFQGSAGPDLSSGTFVWGAGDLPLVDQLVACAVRDHDVDPKRIYTTGCSAGGLFSAALAAERSEYIAAAATDSGGWLGPVLFDDDHTPALMTIHGAPGSDVVVVDFSVTSATADEGYKSRGGFVVNCNHGGGHCGAWMEGMDQDMWAFLKAHPYGVDPHPWEGGLPSDVHPSCEEY